MPASSVAKSVVTPTFSDRFVEVFDSFMSCEFSYITKNGPVTFPVVSFYERSGENFLITSSIAYSSKLRSIAKNPKVSILFSNPAWSGLENPPAVLVQGDARVEDNQDLTAWRAVMQNQPKSRKTEILTKKLSTLDARMKFWPVKTLFEYYVLRVVIAVEPRSFRSWDGNSRPQQSKVRKKGGGSSWVVTLVGGDGYPFSFPVSIEDLIDDGNSVRIRSTPEVDFIGERPCYALFHSHDSTYDHAKQKVIRGVVSRTDSGYVLVPVQSYERNLGWVHTILADNRRASRFLSSYHSRPSKS
jgi:hypothetical protein